MRRRFFVEAFLSGGAELQGPQARHLAQVLRAQVGQQFELACAGEAYLATVASVGKQRVAFTLDERLPALPEPGHILAVSLFKFDRLEWMLEKATELGLAALYPLITRRTAAGLAAAATARLPRWQRVALEAAEQSRRATLPLLAPPQPLARFLQSPPAAARRLFLSESGGTLLACDAGSPTLLLTGPEGGWADDETAALAAAGFHPAWLGPRILRCETAIVAALARLGG